MQLPAWVADPHTVNTPTLPPWPTMAACGIVAAILLLAWAKMGPLGKVLLVFVTILFITGFVSVKTGGH